MINLSLRPEIQRFIDDQVEGGGFPTPEAVVEAALDLWRDGGLELDDDTIAAINEGEEQADRGEVMELAAFRAKISKRFSSK